MKTLQVLVFIFCGNTNTGNHGNLEERLFSISIEIIPQNNSHQMIINVRINLKNKCILYLSTYLSIYVSDMKVNA